ncbi:MAG: RnfABCDGE type electron transport complex subunit D [Bacteroidaceae bacterium]|nr:RnfABCDGE type electron transport complex subunit D [Bacteroidaceae bacterium]
MNMKPIISLSPHVHGGDSVQKNMYGVCLALVPALAASLWFFGLGAAIVLATSVASCVLFEWVITKFILGRKVCTICDGSAILTGLLLGFNLPSNLPTWIIIVGALVAIGVGKMTFGGLGQNPFNPALVGRVFLLISFPVQMTSWPVVGQHLAYTDAETAATPLFIMQNAIASGDPRVLEQLPDASEMLIGQTGGSLGEVSALLLLVGCLFMIWRKIITWHIPVSILGTVAVLSAILHASNPVYALPTQVLCSGGLMLGACFMATDYVTSPMSGKGQIIYGISIGVLTIIIRNWGAYPEGMSFAILIMNAFTPLINTYCKPERFGEVVRKEEKK